MPIILIIIGLIILYFVISSYITSHRGGKGEAVQKLIACGLFLIGFILIIRGSVPVGMFLGVAALLSWQGSLWKYVTRRSKPRLVLSREEALNILGLNGDPSVEEIKDAYRKLMQKNHPDQGGSEYFATKLNYAKDILLKK